MGVITILLGMICILYYIAGVRYAGYRVSGLWIWLVAGLLLAAWGGCRIGCKIAGIPFFVPGAVVVILRACILAGLGMFFYLEYQIGTGMKAQGVENLDYIIVLGCQVKGTKPSRALKDRLDTKRVSACESGDDCDFVRRTGKTGRNLGGGVHVPVSGKCRNQQREVIDGSEIHNDQTESPVQPKIYGLSA